MYDGILVRIFPEHIIDLENPLMVTQIILCHIRVQILKNLENKDRSDRHTNI